MRPADPWPGAHDREGRTMSPGRTRTRRTLRPLRRPVRPGDADRARSISSKPSIARARADPEFRARAGRRRCATSPDGPTPLFEARRFSEAAGCRVFLKREDLLHTGAHKINNTVGQCLLTRRMGKPRVIAETGAGQHGVATAAAARALRARVRRLHGRRGHAPPAPERRAHAACSAPRCARWTPARRTLKDAINEALRDWVTRVRDTHYVLGSVLGPASVPDDGARLPPRDRRSRRARSSRHGAGGLPDVLVACVGGGSNAIGLFHAFLGDAARAQGGRRGRRATGIASRQARGAHRPSTASACSTARARWCFRTSTA